MRVPLIYSCKTYTDIQLQVAELKLYSVRQYKSFIDIVLNELYAIIYIASFNILVGI